MLGSSEIRHIKEIVVKILIDCGIIVPDSIKIDDKITPIDTYAGRYVERITS